MDKCFHSRTSCSGIWRRCYTSPITTFFRSTLPLPRPASFHPPHLEPGNSVRASLPLQCPCRSPVVLYVPFHGVDCTNKPLSQLLSSSFTVALALIMEVSPPLWPSCRQPLASHHHHLAWFLLCNLLFPDSLVPGGIWDQCALMSFPSTLPHPCSGAARACSPGIIIV